MKLLIASNNKHKIKEISEILAGKFDEITSLEQAGIVCDPEETGATFSENAVIKATAVAKACKQHQITDFAVLADDTGLCVEALGGAPGVFSARYAATMGSGTNDHNDAANRAKLLRELAKVCDDTLDEAKRRELRKAYFECAVVLMYPNGKLIAASGRVDGHILEEERGEGGFGYDSLFFCDELGKTFAEASEEEKNGASHRGRALKNLLKISE